MLIAIIVIVVIIQTSFGAARLCINRFVQIVGLATARIGTELSGDLFAHHFNDCFLRGVLEHAELLGQVALQIPIRIFWRQRQLLKKNKKIEKIKERWFDVLMTHVVWIRVIVNAVQCIDIKSIERL